MEKTIKFKCKKCGIEEEIPAEVVDMLEQNDEGDLRYPPRFRCEKCPGLMEPVDYISRKGIHYKFSK